MFLVHAGTTSLKALNPETETDLCWIPQLRPGDKMFSTQKGIIPYYLPCVIWTANTHSKYEYLWFYNAYRVPFHIWDSKGQSNALFFELWYAEFVILFDRIIESLRLRSPLRSLSSSGNPEPCSPVNLVPTCYIHMNFELFQWWWFQCLTSSSENKCFLI